MATSTQENLMNKASLGKDECDVCKIMEAALMCQNPFDLETVPAQMINIASGQVASTEVCKSLNAFMDNGKKKHQKF
jgi:hypothetical protein